MIDIREATAAEKKAAVQGKHVPKGVWIQDKSGVVTMTCVQCGRPSILTDVELDEDTGQTGTIRHDCGNESAFRLLDWA